MMRVDTIYKPEDQAILDQWKVMITEYTEGLIANCKRQDYSSEKTYRLVNEDWGREELIRMYTHSCNCMIPTITVWLDEDVPREVEG